MLCKYCFEHVFSSSLCWFPFFTDRKNRDQPKKQKGFSSGHREISSDYASLSRSPTRSPSPMPSQSPHHRSPSPIPSPDKPYHEKTPHSHGKSFWRHSRMTSREPSVRTRLSSRSPSRSPSPMASRTPQRHRSPPRNPSPSTPYHRKTPHSHGKSFRGHSRISSHDPSLRTHSPVMDRSRPLAPSKIKYAERN